MHKPLACLALVALLAAAAPAATVDEAVAAALAERKIPQAPLCTDATFVRRVYLDVIGKPPTPEEVKAFLQDRTAGKRATLIEALLARPEFADYWSMKWCDVLRVKSEFPINLWPNAVQAYHRWVHDAIRENRPYDAFARDLLTSSGSNFRVPPVNFWRAVQGRAPSDLAGVVALTFMGARLDRMPKERAAGLAAFCARVAFKPTSEWKEEIVQLNPAPVAAVEAMLPDGTVVKLEPEDDPRLVFAAWLIRADNPWFARAVVNRIWAWLMGRGVVHEPDDIREDNPPSVPGLLEALEAELVRSKWDLKQVYRAILNSRTYQASSTPAGDDPAAASLFAHSAVRRLDAEVLADAIAAITGDREEYSSPIPEPYTFIPDSHPTVLLPDGSITSSFLEMFGRPARDTGLFSERNNDCTDAQRLFLLNSSAMQERLRGSARLRAIGQAARGDSVTYIREVYLLILSRHPTEKEIADVREYGKTSGLSGKQSAEDLAWALVNTKEFLFRH